MGFWSFEGAHFNGVTNFRGNCIFGFSFDLRKSEKEKKIKPGKKVEQAGNYYYFKSTFISNVIKNMSNQISLGWELALSVLGQKKTKYKYAN